MAVKEEFRSEGKIILSCLSTDTKPTSHPASTICYETDGAKNSYIYNGSEWIQTTVGGAGKVYQSGSIYGDHPANQTQAFTEASAAGVLWNAIYRNLELNAIDGYHFGQFTVSGLAGATFAVYPEYASATELFTAGQGVLVYDLATNTYKRAEALGNGTYHFVRLDCSTLNFTNTINTDTVVLEGTLSKG